MRAHSLSFGPEKLIIGFEYIWSPDPRLGHLRVSINLSSGGAGSFGVSSAMIRMGQLCVAFVPAPAGGR